MSDPELIRELFNEWNKSMTVFINCLTDIDNKLNQILELIHEVKSNKKKK
jgi:uncharacterized protein YukE